MLHLQRLTVTTKQPSLLLTLLTILPFFLTSFSPHIQTGQPHGRPKTQPRPDLSGPVLGYDTDHFRIHYTLSGEDAINEVDENGNGLPDYVEAVAEALEYSWDQEIRTMVWRRPIPDKEEGGDSRLDVYLEFQDTFYGYVETLEGYVGDNPATGAKEVGAAYGYIGLSHNYETNFFEENPLDVMRTTVAHELHHAIQAAYDDTDPYYWLYEATATWIEYQVYPELGGAEVYVDDYMDAPDICPLSIGRNDEDIRWYGGWILLQYIAVHYGGPDTVQRLWSSWELRTGLRRLRPPWLSKKQALMRYWSIFL